MDIRNLTLKDVVEMGELLGGQEAFIAEMKKTAGVLYIMKKTEDPAYTIDDAYQLTIGELQDEYGKKPEAAATPRTRAKAARVGA